jgi:hypothetical protein
MEAVHLVNQVLRVLLTLEVVVVVVLAVVKVAVLRVVRVLLLFVIQKHLQMLRQLDYTKQMVDIEFLHLMHQAQ